MKNGRIFVLGALPLAAIALAISPAYANSGNVFATQNCTGWEVTVTLNHNVQPDRKVYVTSTIPGTPDIIAAHYDTSYGQIWHESGTSVTTGDVVLDIYVYNDYVGHDVLEFTANAYLPTPENCETTTTTTTVPPSTTTSTQSSTSTSTVPHTSSTLIPPITATSVPKVTTTTEPKTPPALPFTGSSTPGEVLAGIGALGLGAFLVSRQAHKRG